MRGNRGNHALAGVLTRREEGLGARHDDERRHADEEPDRDRDEDRQEITGQHPGDRVAELNADPTLVVKLFGLTPEGLVLIDVRRGDIDNAPQLLKR